MKAKRVKETFRAREALYSLFCHWSSLEPEKSLGTEYETHRKPLRCLRSSSRGAAHSPAVWVSVLFRFTKPGKFSSSSFSLFSSLLTESILPLHSPSSFIWGDTITTHPWVFMQAIAAGQVSLEFFYRTSNLPLHSIKNISHHTLKMSGYVYIAEHDTVLK